MSYDNTNRGALFKNAKKESDNHPDYTGNINVGGVDYWLSAWIKHSESGRTYMSLSVKAKEDMKPAPQKPATKRGRVEDMDSDVPF